MIITLYNKAYKTLTNTEFQSDLKNLFPGILNSNDHSFYFQNKMLLLFDEIKNFFHINTKHERNDIKALSLIIAMLIAFIVDDILDFCHKKYSKDHKMASIPLIIFRSSIMAEIMAELICVALNNKARDISRIKKDLGKTIK